MQLPRNCVPADPSLNSSNVIRLKIEGCNQTDTCNLSETFKNIEHLDISYSTYGSYNCSNSIFQNLIDFNTSFNELTKIPATTLQKFPKLETLDLSHNYLWRIFNHDFQNFSEKLREINLSHNNLAFIEKGAFSNFPHLEIINLNFNRLSTIPTINHLQSIREVTIQENKELQTFDCQFITSMGLKRKVHLSWKYITLFDGGKNCKINRTFSVYPSIHAEGVFPLFGSNYRLHCSENGFNHIESFVAGTQAFTNIRPVLRLLSPSVLKIDLSENDIYELDTAAFDRFHALNELNLSNSKLMDFDFGMLNASQQSLSRLDISKNNFQHGQSIKNPMFLQYFENLSDFNAAESRIKNADDIIQNLPTKIQRLNLASTHISNINAISRLTALEYLILSDANLPAFDLNPFISLGHLINLDISRNNLSNIDFDVSRRTLLHAITARIGYVPGIASTLMPPIDPADITLDTDSFQPLSNLTYLNLSGTNLRKFELKSIEPLKSLQILDISHNHLQNIDLKALRNFTQFEQLYLNDNDLTKLDNFIPGASPNTSFAIARNNMPCPYLRYLNNEYPSIKYIDNRLDQKHNTDCTSSGQAISEFLDSVYDKVKFW